jgi:hypothetical protein
MSQFKRILLPINGNLPAIEYALDMAKRSNAHLYLLKTYRLVEEMKKLHSSDKSLKLTIDEKIEKEIEDEYSQILNTSGVDYELLVEVGFLSDRIISNIKEKEIDMLLLDGLSKLGDDNLVDRFSELNVPVLLIPEKSKDSSAA